MIFLVSVNNTIGPRIVIIQGAFGSWHQFLPPEERPSISSFDQIQILDRIFQNWTTNDDFFGFAERTFEFRVYCSNPKYEPEKLKKFIWYNTNQEDESTLLQKKT